jgi:mono/diheme cytochrome c family protein
VKFRLAAAVVGVGIWSAALALHAQDAAKKTVKDKVYAKEQAERGQAMYTKICSKCHALDEKGAPLEGPPLGGDSFLGAWDGKSVYELGMRIRLGMPPDGSASLNEEESADAVAFILKTNGFPDGDAPLKIDTAAKSITIVKAKQP